MSHPTTTKYQKQLCSLVDIPPQLSALYTSRYRLSSPMEAASLISCFKCGSPTSTRSRKCPKRKERYLIHNCSACGCIREIPPTPYPNTTRIIPKRVSSEDETATGNPNPVPQSATPPSSTDTSCARKKKKSTLQQLLAKSREQKASQSTELRLSAFLQQL